VSHQWQKIHGQCVVSETLSPVMWPHAVVTLCLCNDYVLTEYLLSLMRDCNKWLEWWRHEATSQLVVSHQWQKIHGQRIVTAQTQQVAAVMIAWGHITADSVSLTTHWPCIFCQWWDTVSCDVASCCHHCSHLLCLCSDYAPAKYLLWLTRHYQLWYGLMLSSL